MDQPEWRLFSIREAHSLVREWGPLRREQLRHRVLCRRFWLPAVETRLERDTRHAGLRWKAGPPRPFRRSTPSGVRRLVAHPLGPVLPMKLLVIRALTAVRLVVASARRWAARSPVAARMAAC